MMPGFVSWRAARASLLLLALLGLPGGLRAAPAAIVKLAQPVDLAAPASWPVIAAAQSLAASPDESAKWVAGYDAEFVYLLFRVRDTSPLRNSAGASDAAMLLKGGDAVGCCIGPIGKGERQRFLAAPLDGRPVAVCYRPQSREKRPYTFASPVSVYTMDYVAPAPQVRAAFTPQPDGYAAGLAIPWRLLGGQPAEGLEFAFDVQVIFSDPAGTKNVATGWWASRGNGPACTVDLPTEAQLYPDLWGRARLFAQDPGPQPETELLAASTVSDPDGLQPVPISFTLPRACQVSLVIADATGWIVAEPLRAQRLSAGSHTILWNGRGYRDLPLPPGRYTWRLGYFDGVRSQFVGAAGNSGRPPFPSADKKGSIGGVHSGPAAVGADPGGVYLLHAGEEGEHGLRKLDAAGEVLWTRSVGTYGAATAVASADGRACMLAGFPKLALCSLDAATGRDLPMGDAGARIVLGDPKMGYAGLALAGGRAWISVASENRLAVYDLATGREEPGLALPRPGRLCRENEGSLLALADGRLLRISLADRGIAPVLEGLTAPAAVTVDAQGRIYVAEGGDRQQIGVFSREGQRLAAFGKPGGRALTVPRYDPLEFRDIVDLAVDASGQFWFVEAGSTAPRRIGCLSAQGQWVSDYCGPVYCSSGMVVDLDDSANVYYHLGPSWIKARVNFAPNYRWRDSSWRIESLFYLSQSGGAEKLEPDLMLGPASPSFAAGITFTGSNGQRYFWIDGEQTYTRGAQPAALWTWRQDRWVPAGIQGQAGKPCWADRNGDGRVQPDEMSIAGAPDGGWRWLGRDLALYGRRGVWRPARVDDRGVPDFEGGSYTPYAGDQLPAWFANWTASHEVAVSCPGPDGAVYYAGNLGNGQGRAFWDRASENKLAKVKNGRLEWWIGHHDATNAGNSDGTFLYNVCGVADDVIVVCDVANQYTAYSDDGLTLGWLLTDDRGRPRWSDDSYVSAESFSGQFVKDPQSGKYLLFCGASESCQVREVTGIGPGRITRQQGEFELPSALPRSTPMARTAAIPYATWECSNGRFNGIDGDDWEWWPRDFEAITIRAGKQVVADLRLRRDAGYLYVFADVLQPEGFHAAPGKSPAAGFGRGDGVELLLGPVAPTERTAPAAGDTRVLLTAQPGDQGRWRGLALACRPASAPLPPDPELRRLGNWGSRLGAPPAAPLDLARGLEPVPGAQVAIAPRPDGRGFRLEAEIPLALFPELTVPRPVTFKRWTDGGNHAIKVYTETRRDLAGPLRLNAAVYSTGADGQVRRLAWQPDGPAPSDPAAMQPSAWGLANAAATLAWAAQPGAGEYRLYRGDTPDPAAARLVQRVSGATQASDLPGGELNYYWLTAVDALGESQLLGPERVRQGEGGQEQLRFRGTPAPPLLFPNLPDAALFPGTSSLLHLRVAARTLSADVSPAGPLASTAASGNGTWRLMLAMPAEATPGSRYTVTLTAAGDKGAAPRTRFTLVAAPVALVGWQSRTGGTLEVDPQAAPGEPLATVAWPGQGFLPVTRIGRSGGVLFRRQGYAQRLPERWLRGSFADTFTEGDGFWYGDSDGNMRFDLRQADGTVVEGRDAQGRVRFGSVNSNAGTPGKPETYPGASWHLRPGDNAPHRLTVFSPAKGGQGARQRFALRGAIGEAPPAMLEVDGSQGGLILQFLFIGNVTLTVRQTAGGMGASDPGANCAALFLD